MYALSVNLSGLISLILAVIGFNIRIVPSLLLDPQKIINFSHDVQFHYLAKGLLDRRFPGGVGDDDQFRRLIMRVGVLLYHRRYADVAIPQNSGRSGLARRGWSETLSLK